MNNKSYNCVFIDLEWDQRGNKPSKNDAILEIGAARMNTDISFIKYIKNEDISVRTRRFLGVNQKAFSEGILISQAITDLMEYSEDANTVIVWSSDTSDKLGILLNRYQCMSFIRNVIVLQDLMQTLSGANENISFERALIAFGVNYEDRHMHNASFDAKYLRELFVKIIDKYIENNPGLEAGVITKNNSKIYHMIGCSYLNNVKKEEVVNFVEVLNKKPCRRCCALFKPLVTNVGCNDVIKRNKRICSYKNKPATYETMYEIADYFGLNISGGLNVAIISTGYSLWRVYCNERGYVERLSHENYNSRETGGKGYHDHKKFPKDVFSLFRYIKEHDEAVDIMPMADSLIKIQRKKDKKKKMQKERRRIARMCKLEEE